MDIQHEKLTQTLVATVRRTVERRAEIKGMLDELAWEIPKGIIAGDPFCIFNFITSVQDGHDVELGFPVSQEIETARLSRSKF